MLAPDDFQEGLFVTIDRCTDVEPEDFSDINEDPYFKTQKWLYPRLPKYHNMVGIPAKITILERPYLILETTNGHSHLIDTRMCELRKISESYYNKVKELVCKSNTPQS